MNDLLKVKILAHTPNPEEVIAQVDKIASDKNISFNKVILQLVEYALKDVE